MDSRTAAHVLSQIGAFLELRGESRFKTRAYVTAAKALLALDALHRTESCGGHFREESQTEEGEALRDDENFSFVSAWEWTGDPATSVRHEEPLVFENVALTKPLGSMLTPIRSPAALPFWRLNDICESAASWLRPWWSCCRIRPSWCSACASSCWPRTPSCAPRRRSTSRWQISKTRALA